MDQKAWEYLVDLRRDVLASMNGVRDADSLAQWDNTTPNSATRLRLMKILQNAVQKASGFGVYVVTRHSDCGKRGHHKAADAHGSVWSDHYGLNVEWADKRFVWDGNWLYQGSRYEPCPCSKNGETTNHGVMDYVVYNPKSDLDLCRTISGILSDIGSAIQEAGDKKPRSSMREFLLRAILQLNDAILPVTVYAHIKAQRRPSQ